MREVTVKAHDLAGGTHLRSKQHVDGLAERRAESSTGQAYGFLNGNLLTAANITTIAVRQQQVVVTLLLNGFASAMMRAAARPVPRRSPRKQNGAVREGTRIPPR